MGEPQMPAHMRVVMTGPDLDALGGIAACAKLLKEHISQDARVDTVEYLGIAPRLRTDRVGKVRLALRGYLGFVGAVARRPDILHIHTSRGGDFWRNLPLLWAAYLFRVPLVLHVHPAHSFATFLGTGPRALQTLKLATVGLARWVVVPSELGKRAMEGACVPSRLIAIPNPIDLKEYSSAPLEDRRQNLVYLGWLIREKGIEDLLAVLPQLVRSFPSVQVRLCGPYGARWVRAVVHSLGIVDAVRVDDWVQGSEKTDLLARARVLVLPSYSEGLPIVLLEAMASGTPCVATSVGGIPEVVKDGATGYLVDPGDRAALGDRIERLFSDDEAWKRMSESALSSARRYDARAVSAQLVDVYERVVNRRAS